MEELIQYRMHQALAELASKIFYSHASDVPGNEEVEEKESFKAQYHDSITVSKCSISEETLE